MASSALKRLLQWIPLLTISKDWQDIGFVPKMEISPVVRTAWGATKGCSSGCFVGLGMGFSPWCGSYSLQQTRVSVWYLLLPRLLLELLFCKFPPPKSLLWPRPLRSRQTAWSTPGELAWPGTARETNTRHNTRDRMWERQRSGGGGGRQLSVTRRKQDNSNGLVSSPRVHSLVSQRRRVAAMVRLLHPPQWNKSCPNKLCPVAALFLLLHNLTLRLSTSHPHSLLSCRSFHTPSRRYLAFIFPWILTHTSATTAGETSTQVTMTNATVVGVSAEFHLELICRATGTVCIPLGASSWYSCFETLTR